METLSVSPPSLSSFPLNIPKRIQLSSVPAAMLSTARSQFQLSNQRNFGSVKTNSSFSWTATVGKNVQPSAAAAATAPPTSVPVRVALELLQAGYHYLDVRTPEEFSAGHAVGAVNVPYMFRVGSGMTKNPNFLEEVLANLGKYDEIIVGCQLGKSSLMAATELLSAGFAAITDIAGGYAAWVQNELPTEA